MSVSTDLATGTSTLATASPTVSDTSTGSSVTTAVTISIPSTYAARPRRDTNPDWTRRDESTCHAGERLGRGTERALLNSLRLRCADLAVTWPGLESRPPGDATTPMTLCLAFGAAAELRDRLAALLDTCDPEWMTSPHAAEYAGCFVDLSTTIGEADDTAFIRRGDDWLLVAPRILEIPSADEEHSLVCLLARADAKTNHAPRLPEQAE